MRCLIVQPVHEDGLGLLREAGLEPAISPAPDMASVAGAIAGCDAVITRDAGLSRAAIEAGDRLRVVVVHGTGHDAVDKLAATERGVLVCNTPDQNSQSVAELGLGLALAAARAIPAADRAERSGVRGFRDTGRFTELSGKTALIVGWSTVGSCLGRMLREAFGMEVLAWSRSPRDLGGARAVATLAEGLARADLVSLHTPLTEETRGLIGRDALAAIKPGAILVNTARAGLVDEQALAQAMADGRVAAAGLDVASPGAATGPLAGFPIVIFTPHLGGTTEEALRRVAVAAAHTVVTALAGDRPASAVNDPDGAWPWRR